MLKGIVLYIVMSFTFCFYTKAQQVSLFQSITTKDGLPSNYVFGAAEDSDGFLWIGTDKGLAKYDGFRWLLLTTDEGLPGNYIAEIFSAGKQGLWLSISTKGIYHFNTVTHQLQFATSKVLHHLIQTDNDGNLFFYKHKNIKLSGNVAAYWLSPKQPNIIHSAFQQAENRHYNYVYADFTARKLFTNPAPNHHIPDKKIFGLANDWSIDTMSISLRNENFVLMRVGENIFCSNKSIYKTGHGLAKKIAQPSSLDNTYLNAIRYKNQTVACNEKEGVFFLGDNGVVQHYTEKDGLSSNLVSRAYVLRNGKLLLCTLGGGLIYKLPEGNATIHTGDVAIKELSQNGNYIFAAIENKLLRFNNRIKQTDVFGLTERNIQSVNVWGDNIYVSTLTGFTKYQIRNNQLIKKDTFTLYAGISSVVEKEGRLFAGSYGNYLLEYRGKKCFSDTASLNVNEKILSLKNGIAGFNYEDGLQLNFFSGKKKMLTVKDGLPSNAVYHVHEHHDTLWISTKTGVAVYANGKVINTITAKQGINGNRCIYTFHDKNNSVWILTDKYLGKYEANIVTTYSGVVVRDGLNDWVHAALYDSNNNTIYTGTAKGLFINNLSELSAFSTAKSPLLSNVVFNNEAITDTVFEIPQQYKHLAFSFRPVNVNPFSKAIIFFKLEGRDFAFTELKDSLTVELNKLRSGSYRLIAKTVNEEGVESEEKVLCSFNVTKPFWQQNWFIVFSLLASALGAFLIATAYQKNKIRQKERELKFKQQLNDERERISRELHDNLGSNLVTIIAQSDNIETKLRLNQPGDALKKVQELNDLSRDTMNTLRETIWAVQEASHSYESFVNRIREFLQRTFSVTNIEYTCKSSGNLYKELSPDQTLHLFRCIQECTQNIIKHAAATKANYLFTADEENLSICITDNGKGFETDTDFSGNGLKNINHRINELNGSIEIISAENKETSITIKMTL